MNRLIVCLSIFTLYSMSAFAITDLEQLVVYASKDEEWLDYSMLNTQVIIPDVNLSLSENLEGVAGISLSEIHGQSGSGLKLQGVDEDHVLIMLDGVPINNQGSTVNLADIVTADLAQIEVIQGNSTTLYGSQASAGVVNLVSKYANEESGHLSFSTKNEVSQFANTAPDTKLTAAYANQWHQFSSQSSMNLSVNQAKQSDQSSWQQNNSSGYLAQIKQTLSFLDWRASLNWQKKDQQRQFQEQVAIKTIDKLQVEQRQQVDAAVTADIATEQGQWSQTYNLQYINKHSVRDAVASVELIDFFRDSESYQAFMDQHLNGFVANHDWLLGVSANVETLKQIKTEKDVETDELNGTQSQYSADVYAQDSWLLNENFEWVNGVRAQYHQSYGAFATPSTSFRWDFHPSWLLRANSGLGYRAPTLKERFYFFDHSVYGYQVLGNAELAPETTWTNQINIKFSHPQFETGLIAFYHQFENLVITELDASIENGLDNYVYQNLNRAKVYGLQFDQKVMSIIGDIRFNLQWLGSQSVDNKSLTERPQWQYKLNYSKSFIDTVTQTASLNCQTQHFTDVANEFTSPGYCLINSQINWQVTEPLKVSFAANNLLNVIRDLEDEHDQRPRHGTQINLTLNYQF
jgi:outer membrane receptor for ferrienterochelin and colicins